MKYKLLLAAMLLVQLAYAQFSDSTHYYTNFTTSGSINRANSDIAYLMNDGFKFIIKKKSVWFNFDNNWAYGKQNSALTNNDYSSVFEVNVYAAFPHFFYWGLANYNTSYSLKVNNELLAGAGIAYSIIDRKNAYLNVSDGVLYDTSDLTLPDNNRDVYQTYRNSFRLSFKFGIDDKFELNSKSFLQNSFQNSSDYIIKSTTNFSFKLNKWLDLTTALTYNRQNRTQGENLLFTYGLTLEKYF